MTDIKGGVKLISLQNPLGTCSAYAQTWLGLSLLQGSVVTHPKLVQNQKLMSQVQTTSGQRTQHSLHDNGMEIDGTPIVKDNAFWASAFRELIGCAPGLYYLTIKNPTHAMACIIESPSRLYYLEPEVGMYQFDDLKAFCRNAADWYCKRTGEWTNSQFKIYKVKIR